MKLALLVAFLSMPVFSQTATSVPATSVYQAAVANGIEYISPAMGQSIIDQKASLNWKSIVALMLGEGTLTALTGGVSGVITMPKNFLVGLSVGHIFWDDWGRPILQNAVPNPSNLPPVLQINSSMTSGSENTIYASAVAGQPASSMKKKGVKLKTVSALIGGLEFTFTPQGAQVLRNASGSVINQFVIVDVIASTPLMGTMRSGLDTDAINSRIDKIMAAHLAALKTDEVARWEVPTNTWQDVANHIVTVAPAVSTLPVVHEDNQQELRELKKQLDAITQRIDAILASKP